jgi:hypothetical protein
LEGRPDVKIARSHILHMIEYCLDVSGPVSYQFARYTIDASPYRQEGIRGNSGVRVSWRENADVEEKKAKKQKQKSKKQKTKKAKKAKSKSAKKKGKK